MLSKIIWLKHHCPGIWAVIEKINNGFLFLLWGKRITAVREKLTQWQALADGRIRLLNRHDTDSLVEFLKQVTKEELTFFKPHGFDKASIETVLNSLGYMPIGFFIEDKLAGYFMMRLFCSKKAFIGRYLSGDMRRKGLGGRMAQVLYGMGEDLNFEVFSTISRDNNSSLRSHENMGMMTIVKELPNNYLLVKFTNGNGQPSQSFKGVTGKKTVDVVLSYGWNRVAYNMLRALALNNLRVAVGDSSRFAMAKASRYCAGSFRYRSFYRNPQDFISDLERAFSRFKPQVYLPSHEETFIVARYIDRLRKTGVKIPIADFNTIKTLHRKDLLMPETHKLGIPTPKTFKLEHLDQLKHFWAEAGKDNCVVVKLLNTNSSKGVFYARSLEELKSICQCVIKGQTRENYPIIQEYVEGAGYGVSMLFNQGVLKAKFTHKRLREKIYTGGTSTVRISTENIELENYAERLLSSMNWHGVAMVEFKYNETEKRGWLIEVNPRYWGSLALAIQSGVNFPLLAYKMAQNGDVAPVKDYKKGVVTRWILGDVLAALDCIKYKKKMSDMKKFTTKRIKYDDFYFDDPLPFFAQGGYYAAKFLKGFKMNPLKNAILDIDRI
ncbi:MAG: ATP-grasp domain-containing protein [Candidatus Omnitrophota bacterium]